MPASFRPRVLVALALVLTPLALLPRLSTAQSNGRYFLQTGYTVREPFLKAWSQGEVPLFGLPISGEFTEQSRDNGQTYTVQYFERARLEYHPGPTPAVYLGRLGAELISHSDAASPSADPTCISFAETPQQLCGPFAAFWQAHGGLAIFGLPLAPPARHSPSEPTSPTVQYTERARMELDPSSGTINLGLLGRERLGPGEPPTPPNLDPAALQIVELANAARADVGLPPLDISFELSAAAAVQSRDMALTGVISHTGADGRGPPERIADAGYPWRRCGENIAVGQTSPEEAMRFWLNSPPHRANILDPAMREIGAALYYQPEGYQYYWTMTLGTR